MTNKPTLKPDLVELARLAKEATPGPWGISRDGMTVTSNQYHPIARLSDPFHRQCERGTGKDSEFISAANPETVLAMIDQISALQAQVEMLRSAFHVNMLRCHPDKTHDEIYCAIDAATSAQCAEDKA